MKQELVYQIIRRILRLQGFLRKNNERMERFLSGLTLACLEDNQRCRLTADIYNARGDYRDDGLFDWEESWFAQDLPKAPAKILVGGAGSGREVIYLANHDYQIVAFDPARNYVKNACRRIQHSNCLEFLQGAYEDLNAPHNSNPEFFKAISGHAPFDAILLGWGSFTHIGSQDDRILLLNECRHLCPNGPLLMSLWMIGEDSQLRRGRLWEWGYKVGSITNSSSRLNRSLSEGDEVTSLAGFGHFFTAQEILDLSRASGYELSRDPQGAYAGVFPHITLWPMQ